MVWVDHYFGQYRIILGLNAMINIVLYLKILSTPVRKKNKYLQPTKSEVWSTNVYYYFNVVGTYVNSVRIFEFYMNTQIGSFHNLESGK